MFLSNSSLQLVEVLFVLRNFSEQIETLLDDVSTNKLENLIVLHHVTGAEVDVLRDKVLAVVHNEHASLLPLVVPLFFHPKYAKWRIAGDMLEDGIGTYECIVIRHFGKR